MSVPVLQLQQARGQGEEYVRSCLAQSQNGAGSACRPAARGRPLDGRSVEPQLATNHVSRSGKPVLYRFIQPGHRLRDSQSHSHQKDEALMQPDMRQHRNTWQVFHSH